VGTAERTSLAAPWRIGSVGQVVEDFGRRTFRNSWQRLTGIPATATVLGAVVIATIAGSWALRPADPEPSPIVAAPVTVVAPAPTGPVIENSELVVASGDTLDSLFRSAGLSIVDLAAILDIREARRNLRLLRPGDTLQVRHEGDHILAVRRELDLTTAFEVTHSDNGYQAELVQLPVEQRRVVTGGTIARSLFEAAAEANLSDRVVMKLADIFTWDVDFVRDIGEGDSFAVVYEELWRDGQKLGEGNVLAAEFVNRGTRYTAVRFDDGSGRVGYFTANGRPMRKAFVRAPVAFTRISSGFNPRRRHPILNTIRAHQGVDYAAPAGTPVIAAGDAKVIFRGWKSGYGNAVILQHASNVTTLYGHLSRFGKSARYGARVRQGEVIGYVGSTGLATAPHLHYEYRKNGVHLNPRTVPLPNAEPLSGQRLVAFRSEASELLARLDERRTVLAANLGPQPILAR
jgi:murein DD-endopeptidase MepM/ murein hydrolase activator NlpD